MFGLLLEYVRDERSECPGDAKRRRFLSLLLADLETLAEKFHDLTKEDAIDRLRNIHDSIEQEFANDHVTIHIKDCLEEVERADGTISQSQ